MDITTASDLSLWETIGIAIGVSQNENRNHVKSKFAVFTVQKLIKNHRGEMVRAGDPTRVFKFEDVLFPGAITILSKYLLKDAEEKTVKDDRDRSVVDLKALEASEDKKQFAGWLSWPGGMIDDYTLQKGECYANDINGEPIKDRFENPVKRKSIKVFVQVDMFIPTSDGKSMRTIYMNGMGLQEQGERLERTFWRNPVNPVAPADNTIEEKDKDENPF